MPTFKPEELDFSDKKLVVLFQGAPGTGKSTLGQSVEDGLTIDLDRGISRVKPEFRKDVSICDNFDEVKADVEAAKGKYKTIVVDTGGALVEMLKQYVVDHPKDFKGGAKAMGGLSQQGYGFVKQLWNEFMADLRRNFNVVILFHESMDKGNEDGVFYQIVVEGSTRNTVYQSADLAARLFINNGQRYLGFTPTEQYSAKSCYGISGIVQVPELKDGDTNDFVERLFAKVHANLKAETKRLTPQKKQYEEVMASVREFVNNIETPDDVVPALKAIKALPHALTSKEEAQAAVKARITELGIVYDKATKTYKYAEKE